MRRRGRGRGCGGKGAPGQLFYWRRLKRIPPLNTTDTLGHPAFYVNAAFAATVRLFACVDFRPFGGPWHDVSDPDTYMDTNKTMFKSGGHILLKETNKIYVTPPLMTLVVEYYHP